MICICGPYGRTETAAGALRLADLGLSLRREVQFLALGACEQRVHAYWDRRVRAPALFKQPKKLGRVEHLVWFSLAERLLAYAQKAWPDAQQILVPSWHHLQPEHRPVLERFHRIVCPSPTLHKALRTKVRGTTNTELVLWDAGLAPVQRPPARLRSDACKLLLVCDANSIDECGAAVLHLADEILNLPRRIAGLTLLSFKAWSRRDRQRLSQLRRRHGPRLALATDASAVAHLTLLHEHHLCVLPGVRADFGLWAARALTCGIPVVTYAIPPYTAFLTHGVNSFLVPCEIMTSWCGAVTAVPATVALLNCVEGILGDLRVLDALHVSGWAVPALNNFNTFWTQRLLPRP